MTFSSNVRGNRHPVSREVPNAAQFNLAAEFLASDEELQRISAIAFDTLKKPALEREKAKFEKLERWYKKNDPDSDDTPRLNAIKRKIQAAEQRIQTAERNSRYANSAAAAARVVSEPAPIPCERVKKPEPVQEAPKNNDFDFFNDMMLRFNLLQASSAAAAAAPAAVTPVAAIQPSLPSNALTEACRAKDLSQIHDLIRRGARPDTQTLTAASSTGQISIVTQVIALGAKPGPRTLEVAVHTNNRQIIDAIIQVVQKQ